MVAHTGTNILRNCLKFDIVPLYISIFGLLSMDISAGNVCEQDVGVHDKSSESRPDQLPPGVSYREPFEIASLKLNPVMSDVYIDCHSKD